MLSQETRAGRVALPGIPLNLMEFIMDMTQAPSFASLLSRGQQVTHRAHTRGWLETPDGRFFQPKAADVQFIKHCRMPFMTKPRTKRRWFARLMGIFA